MKGYLENIEALTLANDDFRRVLYTGHHLQLVLMTLQPGEDIGAEVHDDRDQFFRVESGKGTVEIDGVARPVSDDDAVIVPAGARHNITNNGTEPLRMYTLYGPPEHRLDVVHPRKRDVVEEHFDGRTSE